MDPMRQPLDQWVEACAAQTRPDRIHWCDGSQAEHDAIVAQMLASTDPINHLTALNGEAFPDSYLYRSDPFDVARTEEVTYICTATREQAGITNNWMAPAEARSTVWPLFKECMRGRTMYVIPYLMGTPSSPFAVAGVEITDSPYVVLNMRIMSRMGQVARDFIDKTGDYVPGLHSLGSLDPKKRFIMHFPEDQTVWSINSGYGGNALLGKKCLSLRLASWRARKEGWLAEHMLILGLEDPSGKVTYMAGAFPSACGKTNLAMLVSPLAEQGYRVWTIGDDIAWMRIGPDGRLWAMNPEAGFFGVAPGTSMETNPNAIATAHRNTIFTNVALTPEGTPWWEGMTTGPTPQGLIDWRGNGYDPASDKPAAHPNSRFTAPARQCPSISPEWENPQGVPISAILFGGRRARVAPLVYQSLSWEHGVYVGATMASETTAAATGKVGVVRRDPMAMLPFCGYNMADYFGHWLAMGKQIPNPPQIFHVNWFRKGTDGTFLWPGFGQNVRVLRWILERVQGRGEAQETAIGHVPTANALDLHGLDLSQERVKALLNVAHTEWCTEALDSGRFLSTFGAALPDELRQQNAALLSRVGWTK
jgi:phosphoenolpyruvate carboxykinase (GTP)